MANSFDDRSVQRIARTVRTVEKSPLNSPTYRRRSRSRSVSSGSASVFPAIITSGGSGIYTGNILDESGEVIETGITLIPTIATGYDLLTGTHVIAYKVSVSTLGSN